MTLSAARRAGTEAADTVSVGNYFMGGFLASSAGFLVGVRATHNLPLATSVGAGLSLVVVGSAHPSNSELGLEPTVGAQNGAGRYEETFRQGYRARLTARRRRAGIWGGAVGLATWIGVIVLYETLVPT